MGFISINFLTGQLFQRDSDSLEICTDSKRNEKLAERPVICCAVDFCLFG